MEKYDLQKEFETMRKSLTWSGHKLQGRATFRGLNISIENRKGSVRRGVDSDGHEWATKMNYDYGYIRGTEGVDGDHLDCYLGGNKNDRCRPKGNIQPVQVICYGLDTLASKIICKDFSDNFCFFGNDFCLIPIQTISVCG